MKTVTAWIKQFEEFLKKMLACQDALKEIKDESYLTLFSKNIFGFSFIFSLSLLSSSLSSSLLSLCLLARSLSLSVFLLCLSLCLCLRVMLRVVLCVCGRGLCVRACVVYTLKKPMCPLNTSPCVRSKRPRVCRHHAHMLTTNQVISNRLRCCGNCLPVSTSTDTRHVAPSSATTPDTLPEVLMKQTSNATAGSVDSARSSVTRL